MNRKYIRLIVELFISWNGDSVVIDTANIDSAVEYIHNCLKNYDTPDKKLKKLADNMYRAAQYLTTDASQLRKCMEEYHKYVISLQESWTCLK